MVQYCSVPGCTSTANPGISFHHFPKDYNLRQIWATKINHNGTLIKIISPSMRICSKHFLKSDYKETLPGTRRLLKEGAVPTIFSVPSSTDELELPCVSNSNSIVLRDGELRMKSKTVSGLNKVLSFSEKLGQWHLTEEQTDGTSVAETANCPVSIKTEKPDLEGNAAPTSLSNLPANSSFDSTTLKIMVPSTNMLVTVKKEPIDDLENSNNVSEDIIQKAPFTYEELEKHLEKICRPNSWWTVSSCPDYVICTKWNTSYASERKVAICKDLTTKVFLNNVRIFLDPKVSNFEGLSSLLRTVDEL